MSADLLYELSEKVLKANKKHRMDDPRTKKALDKYSELQENLMLDKDILNAIKKWKEQSDEKYKEFEKKYLSHYVDQVNIFSPTSLELWRNRYYYDMKQMIFPIIQIIDGIRNDGKN